MAHGATTDLSMRHLSGAWHVRTIRTYATYLARGIQSVKCLYETVCVREILRGKL